MLAIFKLGGEILGFFFFFFKIPAACKMSLSLFFYYAQVSTVDFLRCN